MIMMGLEDTGEIPFHTVYLHGLVRDEKGEKMSKVRKNVLDPINAIEKYGTDALRFAITTGTSPGNDTNLGTHKLEAARNFGNKIWNAARFILQSFEAQPFTDTTWKEQAVNSNKLEDRWILSRLNRLTAKVDELMNNFQFGEAEREIHDFFWNEFCDWYIEMAKLRLSERESSPLPLLAYVLETSLRLLHPFMPFITEEIWQNLKQRLPEGSFNSEALIIAPYPEVNEKALDADSERIMDSLIEIVRSIRNARAEYKVAASRWIEGHIYADELEPALNKQAEAISVLSKTRPLTISSRKSRQQNREKALVMVLKESDVVLPWEGIVDITAEINRLEKEMAATKTEIERLEQRLKDEAFLSKAPTHVVDKERERLQSYNDKVTRLEQELTQLT
jgi:valyl-tRNA synthetase